MANKDIKDMKDYVVLDINFYDELVASNINLSKENIRLQDYNKVFENFFINKVLEGLNYEISHIEEYNLKDYYFREIYINFLEYGSFEVDYVIRKVMEFKEFKKEGKENDEE